MANKTFPTKRQKDAAQKVLREGKSVSAAMREVGYDDTTAKNPKNLTDSKGWKELMDQHLPERKLAEAHKELLSQTRADYFSFPRMMKDEEIMEHVTEAGFDVITIRYSEKGKLAFYSVPDAQAKKSALDMAYKLRGSYAPEKRDVKHDLSSLTDEERIALDKLFQPHDEQGGA